MTTTSLRHRREGKERTSGSFRRYDDEERNFRYTTVAEDDPSSSASISPSLRDQQLRQQRSRRRRHSAYLTSKTTNTMTRERMSLAVTIISFLIFMLVVMTMMGHYHPTSGLPIMTKSSCWTVVTVNAYLQTPPPRHRQLSRSQKKSWNNHRNNHVLHSSSPSTYFCPRPYHHRVNQKRLSSSAYPSQSYQSSSSSSLFLSSLSSSSSSSNSTSTTSDSASNSVSSSSSDTAPSSTANFTGSSSRSSKSKVGPVTFNLIKAIAGSGVLALPSGLAAVSDTPTPFTRTILPAIVIMTVLGILSAYTFGLYGRLIHTTGATSLGELWEIINDENESESNSSDENETTNATTISTGGSGNSAWIVSVAASLFCFGASLSYTILLGDVASSLAQTFLCGGGTSSVASSWMPISVITTRQFWIVLLTGTVLYPLCRLQSLLSLAPLSLAGVGAVLITTFFIAMRCPSINPTSPYTNNLLGGSSNVFLKSLSAAQRPIFNTYHKGWTSPSSLVLLGMAASAYLGHFTAPDLYNSVKRDDDHDDDVTTSPATITDITDAIPATTTTPTPPATPTVLKDFYKVTVGGFLSATVINCLIMIFGWWTFGGHSQGVILNNYSTLDVGATICRFLTGVSVVGGFPFLIRACRSELLELWKLRTHTEPTRSMEKDTTKILLLVLALSSMVISNAGFVIGLIGALMGSLIVYIFPSLQYLSYTDKLYPSKAFSTKRRVRIERMVCKFLVGFGIVAAAAGGGVSIINNFFPHLLQ